MVDSVARSQAMALAAALLLTAADPASAGSDIYVCQDADGRKTYQNTGAGKGCTRLDIQPVLTVPGPRRPAAKPAPEARPIAPASFPRVDSDTQRVRDTDRRRILEDELASEEARLQSLRSEFESSAPERTGERNGPRSQERIGRLQADLQRSENNIASLKRELALLSRQ